MFRKNGKPKVMEKHKPGPGMAGLDDDIASFINSLVDQNSELINKLEHVDSLKKLADRTVLEARKEAESIKTEAERRVAEIIAEADKKAKAEARKIISRAKKKAEKESRNAVNAAGIELNDKSD
ncbi:MAG: hypothetical protein FJ004_03860 [Chloroflexi bacterium]|nr:hypothetical protein [Chloroflexota bacterium]